MMCMFSEWKRPPRPNHVVSTNEVESMTSVSPSHLLYRCCTHSTSLRSPSARSRASVRGDVPEFRVSATVIGILSIEEDDVFIGLDNPHGRALPWGSQRLARHDWIVLVRPLIEFLNLVPKLGLVNGTTRPKPRARDPLIIHPEVVLSGFAADVGVDSPARPCAVRRASSLPGGYQ